MEVLLMKNNKKPYKNRETRIKELKSKLNHFLKHPELQNNLEFDLNNFREIREIQDYLSRHHLGKKYYLRELGDDSYTLAKI